MAKAEVTLTGVTTTTGGAKRQVPNHLFETVTYTGNGSTQNIAMTNITDGVDFVWLKHRSGTSWHDIYDSIRGATKPLHPNDTNVEGTAATRLTAFNASSFDLGADTATNDNTQTYVAWCASLPNHTASNTDGTITSETKNNDYMSIVSYTGTGANATVGHSLGKVPELIIVKNRTDVSSWVVYDDINGATNYMILEGTNASAAEATTWNNTAPTSTVVNLGSNNGTNGSSDNMIAYCFASVNGVCKVGKYTGTGATGNVVDCGFQPSFVMIKRTDSVANWGIFDSARGVGAGATDDKLLYPNLSNAEDGSDGITFTASGFTLDNNFGHLNATSGTYIYLAIAESSYKTVDLHELTYGTQASAPTSAKVLDRSKPLTVSSKLFDGTKFNYTYGNYVKQGRALATKLESSASGTTVIQPVTVNLNKNP